MTLRDLPSVNDLLQTLSPAARSLPHALVVNEIRTALQTARQALKTAASPSDLTPAALQANIETAILAWLQPSQRHVINATGVVLHTNLGRAPLAPFDPIPGYSNLEYDLATGLRGKRDTHTGRLLEAILGTPAGPVKAIAVNNGAAALFLALNELAQGGEAIVSRGELIEIGDGFRIPDIMQRSGAILREVGTTNRTHIDDYRDAINERTRILLRVHPSNFRITGFTSRPSLRELVDLGRERSLPVYEDLGSGCIVDLRPFGIDEPLVQTSLETGANLVSFSGDKMLGGPQAGILAGDPPLIAKIRRNPLFRALRLDKLFYQSMETTLRHVLLEQYDRIPALRMIAMRPETIRQRAQNLASRIGPGVSVREGTSVIGGGSTPDRSLPTWLLVIEKEKAVEEEKRLRANRPPVIARIEQDQIVLDLRTVFPEEEDALADAIVASIPADIFHERNPL